MTVPRIAEKGGEKQDVKGQPSSNKHRARRGTEDRGNRSSEDPMSHKSGGRVSTRGNSQTSRAENRVLADGA